MTIENTVPKDHELYDTSKRVESFLKSVTAFDGYKIKIYNLKSSSVVHVVSDRFKNDYSLIVVESVGPQCTAWCNFSEYAGRSWDTDIGYFIHQMEAS